jgi:hypothetical protein
MIMARDLVPTRFDDGASRLVHRQRRLNFKSVVPPNLSLMQLPTRQNGRWQTSDKSKREPS